MRRSREMTQQTSDPYLWLEDVLGDEPLNWVRTRNEPTVAQFAGEDFEQMRAEALEIGNADTRIPDGETPRQISIQQLDRRRASARAMAAHHAREQYRTDKPDWDVVLDVDALAAAPRTKTGCWPPSTSSNRNTPVR